MPGKGKEAVSNSLDDASMLNQPMESDVSVDITTLEIGEHVLAYYAGDRSYYEAVIVGITQVVPAEEHCLVKRPRVSRGETVDDDMKCKGSCAFNGLACVRVEWKDGSKTDTHVLASNIYAIDEEMRNTNSRRAAEIASGGNSAARGVSHGGVESSIGGSAVRSSSRGGGGSAASAAGAASTPMESASNALFDLYTASLMVSIHENQVVGAVTRTRTVAAAAAQDRTNRSTTRSTSKGGDAGGCARE